MVFFPFPLVLVSWEGLGFSTPLGNCSGFWGLGVCCGVEQGARNIISEFSFPEIAGKLSLIIVELSSLYPLVPFSLGSDIFIFLMLTTS